MFCPVCKSEYRDGFTRCSDCDTYLVPNLPPPPSGLPDLFAKLVWSGDDPGRLVDVRAALDKANIPYAITNPKSQVFVPSRQPAYEVRVVSSNENRALELIGEPEEDERADSEESSTDEYVLKAQDGDDEINSDSHEYAPEDWDSEEATCEAWTGSDADLTENIQACLKENGIGSQVISDAEPIRIMIYPADEARAREIIREITEGAPPA